MNQSEMTLTDVLPEDAQQYIGFLTDMKNVGHALISVADQQLRNGGLDNIVLAERYLVNTEKLLGHVRRLIEKRKVHEGAYSEGIAHGFAAGWANGYEEGVKATQQATKAQHALADLFAKGGDLTIIAVERGARHDVPDR